MGSTAAREADGELDPLVPRPIDRWTPLVDVEPGDVERLDNAKIFGAPDDPARWPAWRDRLHAWRDDARRRWAPDGAAYGDPDTAWASRCFSVALVWLWDERLFDHDEQRFTPEQFVAVTADHGGFDVVVLWHAYPIIGIDERNQFDFYRQVPGLAELARWFHERNIRVFVDYNPWDTAGRASVDHATEMAALVTDLAVDGVFLDTMMEGGAELVAALRSLDPPAVLEGESRVSLARIADHQISWAQWFADTRAPGVLRAHWFERGHQQHHTRRWNRDHSEELQSSWMNGTGVVVWDSVFGSWVGWNRRDRSTLRAMLRVQRALADVFRNGEWVPLVDAAGTALAAGIYVTRWQHGDITLWTLVNRSDTDHTGPVLDCGAVADHHDGSGPAAWLDVTTGRSLGDAAGDVTVPARGVAGIARLAGAAAASPPAAVTELVAAAAADRADPDTAFPDRPFRRHPTTRSTSLVVPRTAILIAPGPRTLTVRSRRRETGLYGGAPFVEEWKPLPPRLHAEDVDTLEVELGPVAVAISEVTAAEFARFVAESGYEPAVANRFPTSGEAGDEPATRVGLADARAYARWRGARLPTEHEWQVAAGDPMFRRARPEVWNWTESEHSNGVTRFVVMKGGSAYRADASEWYFDGGVREPEFSAKFLLPGLGLDRSSAIGFRIAWDRP